LLTTGITITLAHHAIKTIDSSYQNSWKFINYLVSRIILGLTFLICQWIEYTYAIRFRWTDNVYGSIFFIITGFYDFYVLLGNYGLLFCLLEALLISNLFSWNRITFGKISEFIFKYNKLHLTLLFDIVKWQQYLHHIGFEAVLWYWHFVDVIWIFVFVTIYWWGSLFVDNFNDLIILPAPSVKIEFDKRDFWAITCPNIVGLYIKDMFNM